MARNREDGLSIAVWENSPWRSFIRFQDSADTESDAETAAQPQLFSSRHIQDVSQAQQQESDDVREIFGRALDVARSRKAFASAATVTQQRKDVMRSEARLMAEDNRGWGGNGHSKWSYRADNSSDDLDDYEAGEDNDDGEDNAAEQVASARRPTENSPGPLSRDSSVRGLPPPPPHLRRGTATGSGGVEDADGHGGASPASSSSRAHTRLHLSTTGGGDFTPQLSLQMRSPQGAPSGSTSPFGDGGGSRVGSPGLGAFGSSAARARAARAAAATAHGSGGGGAMGAKLLHMQAANMPTRQSIDVHTSRKPLSPSGPPPPRRSNSFGASHPEGAGSTAAAAGSATTTVFVHSRALGTMVRDRRSTTATGTYGSTGEPCRGIGGGSGSIGGGLEHQLQRDAALLHSSGGNRSRRAALLAGEDGRSSYSDGGGKSPALTSSPSGRLPDPHGMRLHATQWPSKVAAATGAPGSKRLPRASSSYSQLILNHSLDVVRKQAPGTVLSAEPGRYGPAPPGSSGSGFSEGRSIMGGLRGFFSQQQ